MDNEREIDRTFGEMMEVLDVRDQRKAMRSAMRREANKVKKMVGEEITAEGLGTSSSTGHNLWKGLRVRVFPQKYGAGFMVSTKPRGGKGYHKNRWGKEKPVLMWAADGTKMRHTKGKGALHFGRKGHSTGRMPKYDFMAKTEDRAAAMVERDMIGEVEKEMNKRIERIK